MEVFTTAPSEDGRRVEKATRSVTVDFRDLELWEMIDKEQANDR